ncbi:hypothetical protein TNIN_366931 [Trichonephila inaurata madagascariensis]|uniref:Mos1 transposase HTH domain-containing protein n=1 Tax=Trichonephila inaurata madagascariensis TaxID=2747483 RepID=A0A8X6YML1_9ARAC|nr:hypothetical protein TNIN_366931 [Trichonephila inaurata madagascariensis]
MPVKALETFKDVIRLRDVRIAIQREFWLGHSAIATVAKVNKAYGAGTTSEWTVRKLFDKFHSGDMEIDHKLRAGRAVWCDVYHLWQKTEVQSLSMVRQLGTELDVLPQTVS